MSASDLGRKLLNETVAKTLDEILKTLRTQHAQQEDSENSETSRVEQLLSYSTPSQPGRQARLPVLEICSEETGAGKSQLLYYIIGDALLPDVHTVTELGGKTGTIVFLDTNGHFNIDRLARIMTSNIKSNPCDDKEIAGIEYLVESSVQHLHVFQPRTMTSLLETLTGLEDYLFNSSAHSSSDRAVHSIVIDSASAFYWENRAALETDRISALDSRTPGASTAAMPPPWPNQYALLVNRLRSLQQTLGCAVIATSTATKYKDPTTGEHTIRTIPAPWANFPTARVMVKREFVRKFALGISWEDAERDRALRQEAVDQRNFVNTSLNGGENFKFAITSESVRMLDATREAPEEAWQEE